MTYDDQITLIAETWTTDANFNQISLRSQTTVLCSVRSVGRNEFYSAAQTGLRPVLVFVVHRGEYDNQAFVEYQGTEYRVLRSYAVDAEEIELTCERVIGCQQ